MKWPEVELGSVCRIRGGKRLPKGHDLINEATSHPYIRARDIRSGKINFTDPKYITQKTFNKICRYIVTRNDVIMTIVGANIGDIAYVSNEFDGANLTENAVKLSVNKNILDSRFLKYSLLPYYVKEYLQIVASGAAQGKLGLYKIKKIPILLPPLKIQKEIVSVLSAYDDLIENNLKRIKLLEELAQITYEEWFVRMHFPGHENTSINSETGLPEGWERKKLGDVTDLIKRGISPKYVSDNGVMVINQKCIRHNRVNFSLARQTSTDKKIPTEKFIKLYDILVNSTGTGTLGRVAQCFDDVHATVDSHVTIVRANNISSLYLGRFMESVESFLESLGKGATNQKELSAGDMASLINIVVPSNNLQKKYHDMSSLIYKEISNLITQNALLQEARDILLPRLMTGLIDVEHYDPAKLLAREAIT